MVIDSEAGKTQLDRSRGNTNKDCAFTITLQYLPVNRYPSITPPSIRITAVYPGATAEDVASSVAAPIEQQLSGLRGLLYFKSSNSSDGVMSLQVFFDINRDQDLAAVAIGLSIARCLVKISLTA